MKRIAVLLALAVLAGPLPALGQGGGAGETAPVAEAAPDPGDIAAPDGMRWLYGSGEAAGASIQAWRAIADYAIMVSRQRDVPRSVPMGLPDAPGGVGSVSCLREDGTMKPFAAVFDVDETVILNRGIEYWSALGNEASGATWEDYAMTGAPQVAPVPGAVTGIRRLREAGIAVMYNTNRRSNTAAGVIAAIEKAGLGPAVHLENLFLAGDDAMGSRKDGRRAMIAEKYCVIALGGDNLGDFADVFNTPEIGVQERRQLAARGDLAQLWGAGWFAIPNSAYGFWQKGTVNEIFPPDARWQPGSAGGEAH